MERKHILVGTTHGKGNETFYSGDANTLVAEESGGGVRGRKRGKHTYIRWGRKRWE